MLGRVLESVNLAFRPSVENTIVLPNQLKAECGLSFGNSNGGKDDVGIDKECKRKE